MDDGRMTNEKRNGTHQVYGWKDFHLERDSHSEPLDQLANA